MDWHLILGSGGFVGIAYLVFKIGSLVERIKNNEKKQEAFEKNIDDRFNKMDEKFHRLDERLGRIESALTIISVQIGKLETRVEERTLRVVHVSRDEKEQMAK